ncbi:MAG: hypothetical protein H8D23_11620 [Candidatus Brocadiales bacterium]|nr:hypothetical protein [Candidatus Brocadiales bacterium]
MAEAKYKVLNNTSYHEETPHDLCLILEILRIDQTRIKLNYGDVKTGKSWEEVYDITGRIGRSTGTSKIPLLIHNVRSIGGGAILDHCIIEITESKKPYRKFYTCKALQQKRIKDNA